MVFIGLPPVAPASPQSLPCSRVRYSGKGFSSAGTVLGGAAGHRLLGRCLQQHPEATVLKELVEVESAGKELRNRPVLQEALTLCRKHKAALQVQKVDRITILGNSDRALTFTAVAAGTYNQTRSGTGIFDCDSSEELYIGGNQNATQLDSMTTGDPTRFS